uniref:UPF0234 protein Tcr_1902 n=3 Tax=Anthurium amnicola TaxID=1678845 RepID=A0A1D1ZKR5_9ARAE
MKLMNLGHAQSKETRVKIGAGVRKGWQRRREWLLVQETCCLEWQNIIAEASRLGYCGDDELQWNSYEILGEQLKKEWLESIEKRKTMSRSKGSKRAPKSPEQRKKISEAISAKWTDPEYRKRVCSALAKYHGTPVGAERNRRRKLVGESQSVGRRATKKKTVEAKDIDIESTMIKKVTQRKNKTSAPLYKDPMASSKLEMIKKIREQRAAMEAKKREATERAMLLIAEAQKAAEALEVAARKSPLARASLLEAKKLIAEATRSIESIETGWVTSEASGNSIFPNSDETAMHSDSGPQNLNGDTSSEGRQVNGRLVLSVHNRNGDGLSFSNFTKQNFLDGGEPLSKVESTRISMERADHVDGISSVSNGVGNLSDVMVSGLNYTAPNGSIRYTNKLKDNGSLEAGNNEDSITSVTKPKKKWVRGRLVEVEE